MSSKTQRTKAISLSDSQLETSFKSYCEKIKSEHIANFRAEHSDLAWSPDMEAMTNHLMDAAMKSIMHLTNNPSLLVDHYKLLTTETGKDDKKGN